MEGVYDVENFELCLSNASVSTYNYRLDDSDAMYVLYLACKSSKYVVFKYSQP